jgi:hypothetical protein
MVNKTPQHLFMFYIVLFLSFDRVAREGNNVHDDYYALSRELHRRGGVVVIAAGNPVCAPAYAKAACRDRHARAAQGGPDDRRDA